MDASDESSALTRFGTRWDSNDNIGSPKMCLQLDHKYIVVLVFMKPNIYVISALFLSDGSAA